jgi:two-component system, chemotaxis family, protein-glutamate methylesterase/glutaminase
MPIRVLIVEDSPVFQTVLKNILSSSPEIEVVGIANNGLEGLSSIPKLQPDVICTDFHMPKMGGLEFTQQVMTLYPRPILVISVSVQPDQRHRIFELLEAGAVDIFPKPRPGLKQDAQLNQTMLINKIKILSGVKVVTKRGTRSNTQSNQLGDRSQAVPNKSAIKIVAIGTSTGGPQALQTIFEGLPANFPVPIVCVQHISHGFLDGLIQWLSATCPLSLTIASPDTVPQPGTIYFPPEGKHLELNSKRQFICSDTPPVGGHRPAVDVTFKSIAQIYGQEAIAVLLTGMGKDGAEGMLKIQQAGGFTIAQDQETSIIFGMPKEAIAMNAVKQVWPIQKIASVLLDLVSSF